MKSKRWVFRVFCETENEYVISDQTKTPPSKCPNSNSHIIDQHKTHKVEVNQSVKPVFSTTLGRDIKRPYYEVDKSNFVEITIFSFEGLETISDINHMQIITSATRNNTEVEFRLVNNDTGDILTSGTFICADSYTEYCVCLENFSNVPVVRSILSFQARVSSGNGDIRLYSLDIK